MQHNPVVSRDEWLGARKAPLLRELVDLRAAIQAERLALPRVSHTSSSYAAG